MGDQLKYRGQLVAHEDWVTSIAATSEVRDYYESRLCGPCAMILYSGGIDATTSRSAHTLIVPCGLLPVLTLLQAAKLQQLYHASMVIAPHFLAVLRHVQCVCV